MKCMAKAAGPKLRINAVLPGLLLTDWGNLYGEQRIQGLRDAAVLKKEVCLTINFLMTLRGWGERWGKDRGRGALECSKLITDCDIQTDLDDCADAFIMIAQNTSMTGQSVHVGMSLHLLSCF